MLLKQFICDCSTSRAAGLCRFNSTHPWLVAMWRISHNIHVQWRRSRYFALFFLLFLFLCVFLFHVVFFLLSVPFVASIVRISFSNPKVPMQFDWTKDQLSQKHYEWQKRRKKTDIKRRTIIIHQKITGVLCITNFDKNSRNIFDKWLKV